MVQGGALGTVYQIYGRYVQDWLFKETDWNWRLESDWAATCGRWPTSVRTGWI